MKTVILAGGLGTRLDGDNPDRIPKPLTTIGDVPIIEHVMNIYSEQGFNEFVLCLGYKGNLIKQYFFNYYLNNADFEFDMSIDCAYFNKTFVQKNWIIHFINTGLNTATGSRIKRVEGCLKKDKPFFLTYGDGLAPVNLNGLLEFHKSHGKLITITTTRPIGQFGVVEVDDKNQVINFCEKPQDIYTNINIGYMVVEPEVFNYIEDLNNCWWEADILPKLTKEGQVMAYKYVGSFKALDSPKDKQELENMWNTGKAFWNLKRFKGDI